MVVGSKIMERISTGPSVAPAMFSLLKIKAGVVLAGHLLPLVQWKA
jgi:hypothetical protein